MEKLTLDAYIEGLKKENDREVRSYAWKLEREYKHRERVVKRSYAAGKRDGEKSRPYGDYLRDCSEADVYAYNLGWEETTENNDK